jgi:hypothetical protein
MRWLSGPSALLLEAEMSITPLMDPGVDSLVAHLAQSSLDTLNELQPADYDAPVVLILFRHGCPKARQAKAAGKAVSVAIRLKEMYLPIDELHALLYREGSCPKCGQTARSKRGRVVLIAERPPLEGRVARD